MLHNGAGPVPFSTDKSSVEHEPKEFSRDGEKESTTRGIQISSQGLSERHKIDDSMYC